MFNSPSPAPLVMPAAPQPVPSLAPATMKPPRKPSLPTSLNPAIGFQPTNRSLIGGAATQLGT